MSTSFQRIRFRDTDETNTYTVPINPSVVDYGDSQDNKVIPIIDGYPAIQSSNFDGRIRTLNWDTVLENDSKAQPMLTELRTYVNQEKQIHFGAIDHKSWGWKNIRVVDVGTTSPRGGLLQVSIVLTFFFTESV